MYLRRERGRESLPGPGAAAPARPPRALPLPSEVAPGGAAGAEQQPAAEGEAQEAGPDSDLQAEEGPEGAAAAAAAATATAGPRRGLPPGPAVSRSPSPPAHPEASFLPAAAAPPGPPPRRTGPAPCRAAAGRAAAAPR